MGYLSSDIATIPVGDFKWYIFILEDDWDDSLRNYLRDNFQTFAEKTGREVLVIKGFKPNEFYFQVFNHFGLNNKYDIGKFERPALLITNVHPNLVKDDIDVRKNVKAIVFQLRDHYLKEGSIIPFLNSLALALSDQEALKALVNDEKDSVEKNGGGLIDILT